MPLIGEADGFFVAGVEAGEAGKRPAGDRRREFKESLNNTP
jgi:hypothetical protein